MDRQLRIDADRPIPARNRKFSIPLETSGNRLHACNHTREGFYNAEADTVEMINFDLVTRAIAKRA